MVQPEKIIAKELKKYRILFDLATAMTGSQSMAENLRLVVEMSRTMLATDLAFLALRDDARGDLYVAGHSGLRTEALKTLRTPQDHGLGGLVTTTGKGRVVQDFGNDPAFDADLAGLAEGLASGLAIPIQMGGKSFGVLFAFNTSPTVFSTDDLESLLLVGNIAAVEIERRQIEDRLRDREEKYRLLMDAVPDPVIVFDRQGRQLFSEDAGFLTMRDEASNRFAVVSAWGDDALKDIDYDEHDCWALRLGKIHVVEDPAGDLSCVHSVGKSTQGYICLPVTSAEGVIGVLHVLFKARPGKMSMEEAKQYQASKTMILNTMLEHYALSLLNLKLHNTLKNQSIRDPLTGLFNRRYLDESLRREMFRCRRHGASTGIIMIDVDRFKAFNDTYGHEVGDVILKEFASFLKRHTRNEDILCRYGGEEFILLMPDSSLSNGRRRAEQLCALVRKTLRINHQGITHQITISLGVSAFPESGTTIEAAQNAADAALYQAKQQGRDRVMVAS